MKKLGFIFASLILTLALLKTTPAFASANDFYFESFDADYYLTTNGWQQGELKINETLVAVFPSSNQNHGIDRCIPYGYKGEGTIKAETITVLQDGLPANYSTRNTSDGFTCLRIGDANKYVHGKVEYQISYTYKNVIVKYAEQSYQELYWDTNGTSWSQPFNSLTARLHLEPETAQNLTENPFSCYVGFYGASGANRCSITKDTTSAETVVTFSASSLKSGENLTMNVMFKNDTFLNVITQRKSYLLFIIFFVTLAIFLTVVIIQLNKRKKQADKIALAKDPAVPVQYVPLRGLSVAEMAENYLKSTRGSANVATLIELATSHKIELEKGEKKTFGGYKWKVHVKNLDDVTREQEIILEILNGGKSVKVGDVIEVKSHTSTATLRLLAQSFREKVTENLKEKGLFEKDTKSTEKKNSALVIILFLAIFIPFMFIGVFITIIGDLFTKFNSTTGNTIYVGASYLIPATIIAFVVFLVIVISIAVSTSKYKQRTLNGIKASKYLDGLKEYMELAEADRLKFLQSVKGADTTHAGIVKLYERLLPYAIIFGIEDSWMKELNKYYQFDDVTDPDWVTAGVLLSASDFHSFNTYASSAISSSTMSESSGSSSGFSGGGGGGFSGGGGGGGGGGGW